MKKLLIRTACFLLTLTSLLHAQVPQLISYQGRVGVDGVNFDGSGQFKFAFVNAAGTDTYWSNDGSSKAGSEPGTAITLPVSKGLYAVLLGDATLSHMAIVPATVFTKGDVHLRVWFSDGVNGFQQLTPDRRIAAVGYAMMADSVSDGAITTAKIADGAVTSEKLAAGVVQTANLATGAVGNTQLANSGLTISAGTGLGGGGLVSLGGNLTLSNAGVLSLIGGGGISVDAGTGVITLGSNATSAGTAGAIVARDANGGFTAGTISAALNGNAATATTAGSATNFTGTLAGDVTGSQSATTIADATVTGKLLTGFTSAPGMVAASDSILSAINKLNGNTALKAPLASPTFTGSVTLPAGSATNAPLLLQTGTNLTSPTFGAVEFDGTNVFVTNNSANPTRKTLAFTDTPLVNAQIADGSVSAAKLSAGAAAENLSASNQTGVPSGGAVLSTTETNTVLQNAGYLATGTRIKVGTTASNNAWRERSKSNAPSARANHTAVWTGTEMIVWGGLTGPNMNESLNTGGCYNPTTNTWRPTSEINAPTSRASYTAVWTGSEMIIWGGSDGVGGLNSGGRYNPATNTWAPTSIINAPTARNGHSAIWTGSEMIVWGGLDSSNLYTNTGARYNPKTDTWTPTTTTNSPSERSSHGVIWTGSEMIVWGGENYGFYLGGGTHRVFVTTGARYNPSTNVWTPISSADAPYTLYGFATIWTGSEMIVWGSYNTSSPNVGGRYNPTTDSWRPLPNESAPSARHTQAAVWTGQEMMIWGGYNNPAGETPRYLNSGGSYDPSLNNWSTASDFSAPAQRSGHSAVWTGSEILFFGGAFRTYSGISFGSYDYFNDCYSYKPGLILYLYQRP
jgi:N-acetylneuraminic acid mutarotase